MSAPFLGPLAWRVRTAGDVDPLLRNHDERIRELVRRLGAVEDRASARGDVFGIRPFGITAATQRIDLGNIQTLLVLVNLAVPANVTLTSTPHMDSGQFDGQIVILRRTSAGLALTLRDETGLAGCGMRLDGAANKVLGARDALALSWSAADREWFQLTTLVNL